MFPPSRPFVEGVGWLVKHVVFGLVEMWKSM